MSYRFLFIFILLLAPITQSCVKNDSAKDSAPSPSSSSLEVPMGGNAWKVNKEAGSEDKITDNGIQSWQDENTEFNAFFRVENEGSIKLWLHAQRVEATSSLKVKIGAKEEIVEIKNTDFDDIYVGEWEVDEKGYVKVEIIGNSKEDKHFPNIKSLKIEGSAIDKETSFVENNEGSFFYWGRRGPSAHLNYLLPKDKDIQWSYNEVTVPKGEDALGSFFMSNGFGQGYFGFQVNSEQERRVLFSVWSPFETDNPEEIPEDYKIKLLRKGDGVHIGEFGNEGSGGQSFLRYDWKAGNTYKFLMKVEPIENEYTNYTAWFYAPEEADWKLIASWSRPKTNTWLTNFHSFLENFIPQEGIVERKAFFNNQWVVDVDGNWIELNQVKFSADNTARKGYRMDYAGGEENGQFYLRNCGFFDEYTTINEEFERPKTNQKPAIDLNNLP